LPARLIVRGIVVSQSRTSLAKCFPQAREAIFDARLREICERTGLALSRSTPTSHHADVAIVDVFMPGMGGVELLELVRETALGVRRIAISGADPASGDWVVDALSAANAFAPKPINLKRLCGQIRMLLREA
jgi:DNA-binding response OmpR family regulator